MVLPNVGTGSPSQYGDVAGPEPPVKNGETQDIDARPSDAIALALRTRSPIYMAESVIESIKDESDQESE